MVVCLAHSGFLNIATREPVRMRLNCMQKEKERKILPSVVLSVLLLLQVLLQPAQYLWQRQMLSLSHGSIKSREISVDMVILALALSTLHTLASRCCSCNYYVHWNTE